MAKILVVDDADIMRLKLSKVLEENGHEIVGEAKNGDEAVEKYKDYDPDLVTLDITMPEVDGLEALDGIIAHDPDAKVIMVSAMGKKKKVLKAVKSGAKNFIVKPFDADKVKEAVNEVC